MMGRGLERLGQVPAGCVLAIGGLEHAILKSATLSSGPACRPLAPMLFQVRLLQSFCVPASLAARSFIQMMVQGLGFPFSPSLFNTLAVVVGQFLLALLPVLRSTHDHSPIHMRDAMHCVWSSHHSSHVQPSFRTITLVPFLGCEEFQSDLPNVPKRPHDFMQLSTLQVSWLNILHPQRRQLFELLA